MNNGTLVFDTECYRHYWLIMFRSVETGRVQAFEKYEGRDLDVRTISNIIRSFRLVSFNGINYDMPMLAYALSGASCSELKTASDRIIVGQLKPWEFERAHNVVIPQLDHIDVIEVAPGQGSQKIYGGRMHAPKLQDLPYEPDEVIDAEKREKLKLYCANDLDTCLRLFKSLEKQIALREVMSSEYKVDLRSKSDAQIAETVIRAEVSLAMGMKITRPIVKPGTTFKYAAPSFIHYTTPVLQEALRIVLAADYVVAPSGKVLMPKEIESLKIRIGDGVYRMGNGGLHSSEKNTAHFADADTILVDRDVASYYPAIILNTDLKPEHMGDHFTKVYRSIVERRLAAKAAGDDSTAQTLKIVINGSFGKLGSMWSSLYAPNLMIQTTMTGQLSLLMLIELLAENGIPVVSANTDGIVIKCPRKYESAMRAIVSVWEQRTGFDTEETAYRALYSRDVNNYIAIKPDGKYKTKGAYAPRGLQKNPVNAICVEAVTKFLVDGVPVEETILRCQDIRQFTALRTVRGGAVWDMTYLGKVVRWYRSRKSNTIIEYRTNGNKVPCSDHSMPLMDLPEAFPDDVDFAWYIGEAYDILMDVGHFVRPPKLSAKRRKELEAEQKVAEEVDG